MRKLKAELILFLVASIWAGTFIVIKLTIEDTPPFYFVTIRFLIASLLFVLIFYKKIKLNSKPELLASLVLGFLLFAGFTSQTIGLKYTSASNSALITGISVLLVPFAQIPLTGKKVTTDNWISISAATIGLVMLTKPFTNGINSGDLITLICAVAWAFYIVLLDIWSRKYKLHNIVFIQLVSTAFLSLIPAMIFENLGDMVIDTDLLKAMIYTSVFATLVATYLGNKYQKETTPVRAGIIFLWEQPAAVILAVIFLGDRPDIIQIAGGILMITGILYSESYEYFKARKGLNNKNDN